MRFDLKTPCKHCPFRADKTAIRFSCRERAEEIEETAYRWGFPCHKSAEYIEDEDGSGGYHASDKAQHCIGAIIMYLRQDEMCWPGINNDEELAERLRNQVDWSAPVFDAVDDFLDANTKPAHLPHHGDE